MKYRIAARFWFLLAALALLVPAGARASTPPTPKRGLDSLGDDALMNELAARGLDSLLQRAFDLDHVSAEQRRARLTLADLGRLGRSDLTDRQKRALLNAALDGLDSALGTIDDPAALYRAGMELDALARNDTAMLEYWGDNVAVQGSLRPVAEAAVKVWDRCHDAAVHAEDAAATAIQSPDDSANVKRYQDLKGVSDYALYRKGFAQYAQVLAMDPVDPQRKTLAQAAIKTLSPFDNAEQAAIRPQTRLVLGKLQALAGDFATARQLLQSVATDPQKQFTTPPSAQDQYQARYFLAGTELAARDADAAQKSSDDLSAWLTQQPTLAALPSVQAAGGVLQYRLHLLRAELASDPQTRHLENDAAVAAMQDLLRKQPALQPVVYRLLAADVPGDADLSQSDSLLLQALVRQADEVRARPDLQDEDRAVLERGVVAADQLIARSKHPGQAGAPDRSALADSMLIKGLLLERLGRDMPAAEALLDYVQNNEAADRAGAAMGEAQKLIGDARQHNADDPAVRAAYERFLPIAVGPPFNRTVFAFEYGRLLQGEGKFADAIKAFALVPADDRRALAGKYFQMLASNELLNQLPPGDGRRQELLVSIEALSDQIIPEAQAAMTAADATPATGPTTGPTESDHARQTARTILVGTRLVAADLARRDLHEPQRAIDLLAGIEEAIAPLSDASTRLSQALLIRVQAYMALGKYNESTGELVSLAQRDRQHAGQIVFDMLQNLDAELDRAQAAGDVERTRQTAKDRAQLTGFLVDWARNNPDERIRQYAYGYRVFDAEVQRFAATQEPDAAARKTALTRALARFETLDTPAGFKQYQATRTPEQLSHDQPHYDPAVRLGLARTQFDLENWSAARQAFLDLLNDKQIGAPVKYVVQADQQRAVDNDDYWEAVYKMVLSVQKLANSGEIEKARNYLRRQYVQWGPRVGGTKWKAQFQKLHDELIPEFSTTQAGN